MKKNLFIYAALCALVVTGCSKQDEAETLKPVQGEALNITISATRHEAPSTRTEYEDAADRLIVKWNSDNSDQLGVFTKDNGTTSNAPFVVDGDLSVDGKTARFKGGLTVSIPSQETTVYGYYPYSDAAGSIPQSIPIDLSGQQQDGITDKASLAHLAAKDYMAATPVTKKFSNGDQNLLLEFTPLLTIVSFKIMQAMNVASIKLEAVGTTNLTPFHTQGGVDITFSPFPIFHNNGTDKSSVKLDVINGTISATGMFNMMIFPIATEAMPTEFKVTVTTTDGTIYTQRKPVPEGGFFERGKRYIMELKDLTEETFDVWDGSIPDVNNTYAYSGGTGTKENPYQIATAKDLAQLSVNVNAKLVDANKKFILTENINLNGHEWIPIGQADNLFRGTFDGGGKAIIGMKITTPKRDVGLFGYVGNGGIIKDTNVTGEIKINAFFGGIVAGGISGTCDGTFSNNLTNNVNITITNTGDGFLQIGGVMGRIENSNAITNATLVNNGILNISANDGAVSVGGIIGSGLVEMKEGTTLSNSGAVSGVSNNHLCRVGGLIGYSARTVNCKGTNVGNILAQITGGSYPVYCGGFIGYANYKATIESNLNTGTVTATTRTDESSYAGIRVGGAESTVDLIDANTDANGNPGGTGVVTATSVNGKSYVNGILQTR